MRSSVMICAVKMNFVFLAKSCGLLSRQRAQVLNSEVVDGQVFVVSLHSIWELLWDKAEAFWGPRIKQGFLCWELWGHCQVLLLLSVKLGFGSHLRSSFYPLLVGLVGFDLYLDQLCEL